MNKDANKGRSYSPRRRIAERRIVLPSGRLIGKSRSNSSVTLSASADMAYGYCDDYQPHAVKRMFDYKSGMLYDMRWDEAGNLGQVSIAKPGEMFETGRFLYWTEDNRMHAAVDDRYYSYYAYDHSGERRLKLTGDNKLLDVNADFMATYTILNEPTLYPSAYMVLTNKGYTKHYYAGTERVAARLGGGGLDALYHVIGNNNTIQTKANLLFDQSLEQVNNRILYENDLDCIMSNGFAKDVFGHSIDDVPSRMQAGVEPNHDQFKYMMNSMLFDFSQGDEPDVYFYHSDHLGSASWITDFSGMAVQHIQYLPYGEPYINQRLSGYNERFTFTGKERDEETGYGYFGARYMDHELMTMWLGVDPMADKYPGISPYAYCAWNPVRLVDPDGRELVLTGESENVNNLLKIINGCFSFPSDVFEMVDGKIQARVLTSNEMDNMSMKQKAFYNIVMSSINDEKTIFINVVNNSKGVLFGSWELSSIDVADLTAHGDGEGMNMYSVIGHEIAEQQYKQTSSRPNYLIGHYRYGMKAEDNISGCFRSTESGFGNSITFNYSNYSESARIQVDIRLGADKSIESVVRTKYPLIIGH